MKLIFLILPFLFLNTVFAATPKKNSQNTFQNNKYNKPNKKFWHWSFVSIASEPSKAFVDSYGSIFSYNYFKAKHYINQKSSFAVAPTFYISTAGKNKINQQAKPGSIEIGDVYSEYQYALYSTAFTRTKIGAKIYLPLGLASKKSNLKTRSQVYASLSAHPFYKWQAYYKAEANAYFYKDKTYINKSRQLVGKKTSKFKHFLSLSYLTSKRFSIAGRAEQEMSLYEKTSTRPSKKMLYSTDMSLGWALAYKANISMGLQTSITGKQNWNDLLKLNTSKLIVRTTILF